MTLTAGELFAGYGGLALAVEEAFGAKTKWVAEYEPSPTKILDARFPGVPNHGDVTQIDWETVERVDILSAGTPCQDISNAGRRRGMMSGTRSNLWEHAREAINIMQPEWVVWENVRGAYSAKAHSEVELEEGLLGELPAKGRPLRALGRVLGDLAELGYDAEWRGLRASDVGAPHQRYRVFIIAHRRDLSLADSLCSGGGWGPALSSYGQAA